MQAQAPDRPVLVNKNLGPASVNTNWRPGPLNTNWGPGPLNRNWGPGPGVAAGGKQKTGARGIQRLHLSI